MNDDLSRLHKTVSKALIPFLWLHVPLVAAVAFGGGNVWLWPMVAGAIVAAIATAAWMQSGDAKSTRITIGIGLIAMVSLLLVAARGTPWQGDLHMYYFAALAILATYCDRDVILVGAAVTAVHHLSLNYLAPALVFSEGAHLLRVVLHAVIVILETAALVSMTNRIVVLLTESAQHLTASVAAADAARALENAAAEQRRLAAIEAERHEAEKAASAALQGAVVAAVATGLQRLAGGDLVFRLGEPFAPAYEMLRADFNTAMTQLHALLQGIITNTGQLRAGTGEISRAADDLSRRTENQAATLEETAAALDEITSTVGKMAESAKLAQIVVSRTKGDAELSDEVVRQAVTAMVGIEESSQKIGQIIGVIDEIAFQTNLLALNAGVEAARAGDAGRGFAVVASEVRALAQRSAEAAKEIKTLISTSARQVDAGVKLVGETGEVLSRIMTQVGEIDGVVAQIAAAAQNQAQGLGEINTAINQMDQVTQQNAAMVEESTAASHALAQETEKLVDMASRFRVSDATESTAPPPTIHPTRRPAASRPAKAPPVKLVSRGRGLATLRKPVIVAGEAGWEEF